MILIHAVGIRDMRVELRGEKLTRTGMVLHMYGKDYSRMSMRRALAKRAKPGRNPYCTSSDPGGRVSSVDRHRMQIADQETSE